jgi:hypothetical protein
LRRRGVVSSSSENAASGLLVLRLARALRGRFATTGLAGEAGCGLASAERGDPAAAAPVSVTADSAAAGLAAAFRLRFRLAAVTCFAGAAAADSAAGAAGSAGFAAAPPLGAAAWRATVVRSGVLRAGDFFAGAGRAAFPAAPRPADFLVAAFFGAAFFAAAFFAAAFFAAAFFAAAFFAAAFFGAAFFGAAFFGAAFFAAAFFGATFLAAAFLAAAFFAAAFFAAAFFAAAALAARFLATVFFAGAFFAAAFLAVAFLPAVFFAVDFLAAAFLAGPFRAPDFLAADPRAPPPPPAFLAVALRAPARFPAPDRAAPPPAFFAPPALRAPPAALPVGFRPLALFADAALFAACAADFFVALRAADFLAVLRAGARPAAFLRGEPADRLRAAISTSGAGSAGRNHSSCGWTIFYSRTSWRCLQPEGSMSPAQAQRGRGARRPTGRAEDSGGSMTAPQKRCCATRHRGQARPRAVIDQRCGVRAAETPRPTPARR